MLLVLAAAAGSVGPALLLRAWSGRYYAARLCHQMIRHVCIRPVRRAASLSLRAERNDIATFGLCARPLKLPSLKVGDARGRLGELRCRGGWVGVVAAPLAATVRPGRRYLGGLLAAAPPPSRAAKARSKATARSTASKGVSR